MDGIKWIKVTKENVDIYGVDEKFWRMPEDVAKNVSDGVGYLMKQAAGGRIRFTTNSSRILVRADVVSGDDLISIDVYKLELGREIFTCGLRDVTGKRMVVGKFESREKECYTRNNGKTYSYTVNLTQSGVYNSVEIGVDENATFEKGAPYVNEKPVVFYGSSITHGFAASRPGTTYEAQISQKYNLNYINLGFSGAAKGEQTMAEYIGSLDMSAFVLDYDHNAYEEGQLEATHLPFYKTIREKNPDLPIIMVSRPDFWTSPVANQKRVETIYRTYEYAIANGDKNVYFINGKTLFSGEYYHNCTMDGCHPNDIGMYRMASVIGPVVAKAVGIEEVDVKHDYEVYR